MSATPRATNTPINKNRGSIADVQSDVVTIVFPYFGEKIFIKSMKISNGATLCNNSIQIQSCQEVFLVEFKGSQ